MLIAQRPTLTEESISEFRSKFVIEPLEPGFGYTIGNSLRRTLLSSIPGASVTSIKIEGVQHEFSTIPHMKEDVIEFLLNVKAIRFRHAGQTSGRARLEVQGEGKVCAGDNRCPPTSRLPIRNFIWPLWTLLKPG